MAYGICRIKKLKSSNLKPSAQHTQRQRTTLNADPDREHICIIGEAKADLDSLVRERIRNSTNKTIRKNAVMAVEFLLSASPEYFRPNDPSQYGYWEEEKLEAFKIAASQWLLDTYGDRIVKAELHLDEATPHIHAYLVPIDDKGNLNCRAFFGTRSKLSKLQDSFAKALKPLGLERGVKGSRATHTDIKKYYTTVNQAISLPLSMKEIERLQAENSKLLIENSKLLKEQVEFKTTLHDIAQQWEVAANEMLRLQMKIDNLVEEREFWKEQYKSLSNLITSNSFEKLQASDGSKSMNNPNKSSQKSTNQEKIGNKSNTQDNNPKNEIPGGEEVSPIDVVMQVTGLTYQEAVGFCIVCFGEKETCKLVTQRSELLMKNEKIIENLSKVDAKIPQPEMKNQGQNQKELKQNQDKESIHHTQHTGQNLNKPLKPKSGGIKR